MSRRVFLRLSLGAVAGAVLSAAQLLGPGAAAAAPVQAPATPAPLAARVLYYDASRAAEFVAVVNEGARIWNSVADNVRLEPARAGTPVNIVVLADNGWPRAQTRSLGNGRWWMGRVAVRDGHYPPRIAAHEFGHLLGLPDRRTGLCTDLMSGASAGTSCRNPVPNAAEVDKVDDNFAGAALVTANATRF